jgi:hypothetical protein
VTYNIGRSPQGQEPWSGDRPVAPPPPSGCRYPSAFPECTGQFWTACRYVQRNGVAVAKYQCRQCFQIHNTPGFKNDMLPEDAPPVDKVREKETWRYFNPEGEIREREQREFFERNAVWQANDDPIYDSPEWKGVRAKKLALHPICEGCGEAPATLCHHTTYQRKRSPLLFEIKALCADCHGRLHGRGVG